MMNCLFKSISYAIFFQGNGIPTTGNYNFKYNLNWTSSYKNISQQQLFFDSTYSLKEIVTRLKVRTIFAGDHDSYTFVPDLNLNHNFITEHFFNTFNSIFINKTLFAR